MRFDGLKMREDIAARGWAQTDLAKLIKRHDSTISQFLNGINQSPRVAKAMADALGKPLARYILPLEDR